MNQNTNEKTQIKLFLYNKKNVENKKKGVKKRKLFYRFNDIVLSYAFYRLINFCNVL